MPTNEPITIPAISPTLNVDDDINDTSISCIPLDELLEEDIDESPVLLSLLDDESVELLDVDDNDDESPVLPLLLLLNLLLSLLDESLVLLLLLLDDDNDELHVSPM